MGWGGRKACLWYSDLWLNKRRQERGKRVVVWGQRGGGGMGSILIQSWLAGWRLIWPGTEKLIKVSSL